MAMNSLLRQRISELLEDDTLSLYPARTVAGLNVEALYEETDIHLARTHRPGKRRVIAILKENGNQRTFIGFTSGQTEPPPIRVAFEWKPCCLDRNPCFGIPLHGISYLFCKTLKPHHYQFQFTTHVHALSLLEEQGELELCGACCTNCSKSLYQEFESPTQ